MTTSGRPGKPAAGEQPATPQTGPAGPAPGDEQVLRHEIEHTREQLGQTVEQLAAKTDVQSQARAKAASLGGRLKGSTGQVRAKAAERSAQARGQAAGATEVARHKAAAGRDRLQARASRMWQAAPPGVRRTVGNGASTASQRRVPLAVAAVTLAACYLAFRWWRR